MQTGRQSRVEVGADFLVSLLVNLVGQCLAYGALATVGRGLGFAAIILGISIPRRYMTRRFFNTFVTPGTRQPRWQSWLEIITDTVIALLIAIVLQRVFYGAAATWAKAGSLTVGLYAFTMTRRYALRRFFETWNGRQGSVILPLSSDLSR